MFNVVVVTGSRAEYGIMSSLLKKLNERKDINLEIIATAMHLEEKYGYTYKFIENDGFAINHKINMNLNDTNNPTILKGMAKLQCELADIFAIKKYDLCIILGDRYEMLSVANSCVINQIPICHLHGGEKTLGNYDEFIRHAISKMSHIHLVATDEYKNRLIQLGESNVHNVGALGVQNVIDSVNNIKNIDLSKKIDSGILKSKYFVVLFHPVTLNSRNDGIDQINNLLKALSVYKDDYDFIFIGGNSDSGSDEILTRVNEYVNSEAGCSFSPSLSVQEYHALIKSSYGLIGNSSSGIIEVPSLNKYTLNIGDRQKGRARGNSIVDVANDEKAIISGIKTLIELEKSNEIIFNPYYKPNTLETMENVIVENLVNGISIEKDFIDMEVE